MNTSNSFKKYSTRFILIAGIVVLLNIISSKVHTRFDLTEEKRFSLSNSTKEVLKKMTEPATVTVYLKGDFEAGFQRLREASLETLESLQQASNGKIKYEFINPFAGKTIEEKKEIQKTLIAKGVYPVSLQVQSDGTDEYSSKIIFPYALVSYYGKSIPVSLLENHSGLSPLEKLNYSETQLEYKFVTALKNLQAPDKNEIGYVVGHNELFGENTIDMLTTLEKVYKVDTLDITSLIEIPRTLSALIVCKPTTAFDDKDKFKLDQYVMHGGRILWLLDNMKCDMDTLRSQDAYMAQSYELNIDDMLFKYGVRINQDVIEDLQCNGIPVTVGMQGNQPDIRMLPWLYFPIVIPTSKHKIVNNMDALMFQFTNSIDTIANEEIKKTILLESSPKCRKINAPVRISLASLKFTPEPKLFTDKNIPLGVLLEGKFNSIFTNRLDAGFAKVYTDSLKKTLLTQCEKDNKMIVISDGNIFANDYSSKRGPMECGYYQYTDQLFANKSFLLNCIEYLTDDDNVLEARNKDVKLRLLNTEKIKTQRIQWQLLNIVLPILLLLIFASAYFFFRKKKYEGKV